MKKLLALFLFLTTLINFAQKPFFVQPKWEKNQQMQLQVAKFASIKNDTVNQIANYNINLQLTILDKDKTGYIAKIVYTDFQKNFTSNILDAETLVLNHLQNQEIKVKLSPFGKPLGIINLNQVNTKLEAEFFKLSENPSTQKLSDFGFKALAEKKFAEEYILKILKVYCISTEREVQINKNYSFFKAHENPSAKGVVSYKAHYSLKPNEQNTNLHDLNFIINYDKASLEQVAQNHKFSNPNFNHVIFMKGQKYNLIDLNSGQILQATHAWDIKYQDYTENVQYQIKKIN